MFADAEPLSREPEGERAVTPEQQPAPPLSLHLSTYQASGLQCWWGAEGTGLQSFDSYLAPSVVVDEYWCFAIQNLNQKTIARFSYLFLDEHNLIFWSIWSFNCTVCMCVCVCVCPCSCLRTSVLLLWAVGGQTLDWTTAASWCYWWTLRQDSCLHQRGHWILPSVNMKSCWIRSAVTVKSFFE